MLVTMAGTITMASACDGGMVTASRPIDTVGSPSPITPLMKPASRKATATRINMGSDMPNRLTDRRRRHNLQLPEPAFGHDEGWGYGECRAFRSGRSPAVRRRRRDPQHHGRCGARPSGAGLGQRADQAPGGGA